MGSHGEESLAFGGQALIEGVMIRSRRHVVMCVRQPSDGITTHVEEINPLSERHRVLGLPFVRGITALFETMYLGVKGIYFSANAALEEEEEELTWKEWAIVIVLTVAISSLFFVVPFLLTTLLNLSGFLFNVVEAAVRLALFLLYISLVSMWKDFRRVLQYHGAEHKAINALEAGEALEVASVKGFSRLHRRCGTSFIFIVIIVSIVLFSIMPRAGFYVRLAYRVVLIPVLGAVSYELLRFSARHSDSIITRVLTAPGVVFQRLTTREPDDDMIEVAIRAVKEAIRIDGP
ncbi:MAG: DUF1385 domain-containing protein [Candidatus Bathyarchaeota archaeon]|jgi:uncharacterized protein YqhQ|nr:DUF1385 domain-containing protein [Candidatus Bathyarchaeota archaeon]